MRKVAFVGPTYAPLAHAHLLENAEFEIAPPAQRGDIAAATFGSPGMVLLVDGRFHQNLAVSHVELREALTAGWVVWGLGSLGAIRAFEMRNQSMRGAGEVYRSFLGVDDFQDDEVALLHAPETPYEYESEPLIHIRYAVREGVLRRLFSEEAGQAIVDHLKARWFGERSLEYFYQVTRELAGPGAENSLRTMTRDFGPWRVKTQDLAMFIQERHWEDGNSEARPLVAPFMVPRI